MKEAEYQKIEKILETSWEQEKHSTHLIKVAELYNNKLQKLGCRFSGFVNNKPKGYIAIQHPADKKYNISLFGYVFIPERIAEKMLVLGYHGCPPKIAQKFANSHNEW